MAAATRSPGSWAGIEGARRTKRVRTTRTDPVAARHPDLVERQFRADGPNQLWVTDLTYALDHAPTTGGTRASLRCPAAQLRSPDGWVKHRLSRWLDDTGHPMTPPSAWATIQHDVAATHGAAAAARLRYGSHTLEPSDLRFPR
ncbi:MAG: hypothetical protein JWR81_5494 [Pseudonocardia sp.]|jgi:hypothetical protein|nr:hypothetical protein [Pseudonocardia sp.]